MATANTLIELKMPRNSRTSLDRSIHNINFKFLNDFFTTENKLLINLNNVECYLKNENNNYIYLGIVKIIEQEGPSRNSYATEYRVTPYAFNYLNNDSNVLTIDKTYYFLNREHTEEHILKNTSSPSAADIAQAVVAAMNVSPAGGSKHKKKNTTRKKYYR